MNALAWAMVVLLFALPVVVLFGLALAWVLSTAERLGRAHRERREQP